MEDRHICFEEEKEKIISLYQRIKKFLNGNEYTDDLRSELEKAYPNYLTLLGKRMEDLQKSDHGIVIAGETSAGKTILINKLLEKIIFTTGTHESTSTVCKLRNSRTIKILTQKNDEKPIERDLTDTCDLSTVEGLKNLRQALNSVTNISSEESVGIQSVDVGLPIPFLKGNTILVDTPGIGGSGTFTHKLMDYLSNAVSFIFVINVGSAGGMQTDRLPEILNSILLLHMNNDMPCFDPEDVIFLTNKWDTIKGEVSDEEERNKTWEILQNNIKRNWKSVKDEHIFRMSLTEVSPGKSNSSMTEFQKFRNVLELNVKRAENIRAERHLRFIKEFLEKVHFGLNARLQIGRQTEKQHKNLAEYHQRDLIRLNEECKKMRTITLDNLEDLINNISREVYIYMLSDSGKERILNPPGYLPINAVSLSAGPEEINKRVSLFFKAYQSENILQQFKKLKEDFLSNFQSISSELIKIENDWTYDAIRVSGYVFLPDSSMFWLSSLERAMFSYTVLLFGPISTKEGRMHNINKLYFKCTSAIKDRVYKYLKSSQGYLFTKMVDKVTEDLLPKRIKHLEKTIKKLLEERDEILCNQKSFNKLAEEVKDFQNSAKNLYSIISQNKIERNTAGLL